MIRVQVVYHIFLAHGDSLAAQVVILGHAQRGGTPIVNGEGPGAGLRLVTRPVVDLGRHRVLTLRQAHLRRVFKATGAVDLWRDRLAVHG